MASASGSSTRIARHRAAQRERGLRQVTLWLPDTSDPAYRARLAEQCRRLSENPTADEMSAVDAFAENIGRTPGWR
jgi:hypothetical protein